MSVFEFLLVLISIIIGFGMAEVFLGFARLLRRELEPYWVHTLWGGTLVLLQTQTWWGLWELHGRTAWRFGDLLMLLPPPILLFLAAAILFPRAGVTTDLRGHYYSNRIPFLLIVALLPAWHTIWEGGPFSLQYDVPRVAGAAVLAAAGFSGRPWLHSVVSVAAAVATILFTWLYMWELQA